jgi:hypothetical protein
MRQCAGMSPDGGKAYQLIYCTLAVGHLGPISGA